MAVESRQNVCLDTCVILDVISKRQPVAQHVQTIIDSAENGEIQIVLPTVVIAECLYLREIESQVVDREQQNEAFSSFFDRSIFYKQPAHTKLCKEAALLAQRHMLTPFDAVVVQTAVSTGCDTLVTTDGIAKVTSRNRSENKARLLDLDGKIRCEHGLLRIKPPGEFSIQSSMTLQNGE